ncbi:MAG: site-specific integrase [Candidatus Tectomicrobia bacterium]|nr:site-specific integrase [Candidatus Tectomicrobia bacterium]
MGQGKQAKVITRPQERAVLDYLRHTRNPERDRVTFLLSLKAGLRAKEIAALTWGMVTDDAGRIGACIALPDNASKSKSGRTVYLHPDLKQALEMLHRCSPNTRNDWPVIYSTRNQGFSAATIKDWFTRLYRTLGMDGCSSHSGRRTFITRAAKEVSVVGGSIRDVQQLAGHASLAMTQTYIEGDTEAKRKLVTRV